MRKKIVAKGNMRRGDFMRAVLTDTLPEEVPIIFSNDGFYINALKSFPKNANASEFVDTLLSQDRRYTKPYRYSVLKDAFSARGLSLIHPYAQKGVATFYRQYDSLICYYGGKSPASLRAPYKVGGSFFVRGPQSERNQFRSGDIDTVSLETTVSNPASYFAYNRISRAHQFFDSNEYIHLEKRFSLFRTLDVSKCFNSIYTHTLFWAVADIQTAKDNTLASGFANEFDRLMQSMNFNETNGICIGPEVSRVFAEIIFVEIDKRVIGFLRSRNLKILIDYEFRRYVDDYYVFAQNENELDKITAAISFCLSQFNLHLNAEKTITICRPFSTKKSQIIADTNIALADFSNKFISYRIINEVSVAIPKRIMRSDALIRSFIKSVKATCSLHGAGYETVSDYIVSALSKRIIDLANDYKSGILEPETNFEHYIASTLMLLELVYFFYTVNPTVRSSLFVARSTIVATRLFRANFPDRLAHISECIVRWTLDLTRSISRGARHKDLTAVPVEVLNVLLPMREIAGEEPLVDDLIESICREVDQFAYFEIVTFLFLAGGRRRHRTTTAALFVRGKNIVQEGLGPLMDSQSAHLCFDLLACPFLPLDKRGAWFNTLRVNCGLRRVPRVNAQAAVSDMEAHPWFVRWDSVDLLRLLRKKELSAVY